MWIRCRERPSRISKRDAQTDLTPLPRNTMYAAVTLALLGWAWAFGSLGLLIYVLVAAIAFHVPIVRGEEPWLARAYGDAWQQYASRVPRWLWQSARGDRP
jgi:protein-S-isoprenylcysteine O-methyltransferase Ste14